MKKVLGSGLLLVLGTALSMPLMSQDAKQDMKDAGHATAHAAKKTGHAVKKGTKKAYRGTKKGVSKAAGKTSEGAEKVHDKMDPK